MKNTVFSFVLCYDGIMESVTLETACAPSMRKEEGLSVTKRNIVIKNFYPILIGHHSFLLMGHEYPDEDCIASLVAAALLLRKFEKTVDIFFQGPIQEQLLFLIDICIYNKVRVHINTISDMKDPEVVVILDTPKPSMIFTDARSKAFLKNPAIRKIELDHHLSADACYCGEENLSLVMRASSTCEIIAYICYKLEQYPEILRIFCIRELYSRNIVLAMLTGMMGDAKQGVYLFTGRDKAFFSYFSKKLNRILRKKTGTLTENIKSMEEILEVLEALSNEEKDAYQKIMERAEFYDKIGIISLDEKATKEITKEIDYSQFIGMIKIATNDVAENTKGLGISAYRDLDSISDKIQFRIRVDSSLKGVDLRKLLKDMQIRNGGGHQGAIAFRFSQEEIPDVNFFIDELVHYIRNHILS
ncbi:phosphoesterase [Treponema phagedenis]|nr:DHH family phosphoesterase [Treponema phagedenis]QEJ95436.1 phosphoesterase [Treponema phagedenis]QKS92664.1 DHH family phosphoesterase [Treponema phagedenis]QLC57474.1 DHH family phosphoesterase [Treponema phagedenis]